MLLKLVELRSSDWGRVHTAAAASNATPDNDPNYFMVSGMHSMSSIQYISLFIMIVLCIHLFSLLRMSLRSTQQMALLLLQQTQVSDNAVKHIQDMVIPVSSQQRKYPTVAQRFMELLFEGVFPGQVEKQSSYIQCIYQYLIGKMNKNATY